ncbi:hypothetical protein INR49_014322 [Caranx melampygus]|nr:hypothetical protein INR49_014322 [Caranx melampygus]
MINSGAPPPPDTSPPPLAPPPFLFYELPSCVGDEERLLPHYAGYNSARWTPVQGSSAAAPTGCTVEKRTCILKPIGGDGRPPKQNLTGGIPVVYLDWVLISSIQGGGGWGCGEGPMSGFSPRLLS